MYIFSLSQPRLIFDYQVHGERKAGSDARPQQRRAPQSNGPGKPTGPGYGFLSNVVLPLAHLRELEANMVKWKSDPATLAAIRQSIKEAEATEASNPPAPEE